MTLGLCERRIRSGGWASLLQSFADRGEEDSSPVRCATMLEHENALPHSELHFAVHNRDDLAGVRQDHADV